MQNWVIIPVDQVEYSQEALNFARQNALLNLKNNKFDTFKLDKECVSNLGERWQRKFSYLCDSLEEKYNGKLIDLIELSRTANFFTFHYESALRSKPNDSQGRAEADHAIFLARHYPLFCEFVMSKLGPRPLPVTGDILRAICIEKMIQAAQCIGDDIGKALDFLYESINMTNAAERFENKIDSYFEYTDAKKEETKKNGRKGAENRHMPSKLLRNWVIEEYKRLLPSKEWVSANAAALDLIGLAIDHGRTINATITKTNGQRKIAEWINAYKKTI